MIENIYLHFMLNMSHFILIGWLNEICVLLNNNGVTICPFLWNISTYFVRVLRHRKSLMMAYSWCIGLSLLKRDVVGWSVYITIWYLIIFCKNLLAETLAIGRQLCHGTLIEVNQKSEDQHMTLTTGPGRDWDRNWIGANMR